jgi:hypothetical protein
LFSFFLSFFALSPSIKRTHIYSYFIVHSGYGSLRNPPQRSAAGAMKVTRLFQKICMSDPLREVLELRSVDGSAL